jgi:L-rhamnose mutarotase
MQINLLSFSPLSDTVTLSLFTAKTDGSHPYCIYQVECPALWQQNKSLAEHKELYFTFDNTTAVLSGEEYRATINLYQAPRIAKHYFRHLLYNYFQNRVAAVGIDYVGNLEVWVKDSTQPNNAVTQYLKFSLVPQYRNMSEGFELLVSFNGYSETYNRSIAELDTDEKLYSKVIAGGQIVKYKLLTPEHKNNITQIFPVINRTLAAHFGLKERRTKMPNKYISTCEKINDFCRNYLFINDFTVFNINANNFITVPQDRILKVSDNSNILVFGNNRTDLVPYNGITNYSPFLPTPRNNVKFFFIAHRNEKEVCGKLYSIFRDGLEKSVNNYTGEIRYKFKPLADYIKQPFNTDPNGSIFFENLDTATQEISAKLQVKTLEKDCFYLALYISPINKDDTNNPHHSIYFKIKELLLEKGITSQAIYKDRPNIAGFNFHLPNIATAILAKIGGIPWQLQPTRNNNDLIVGVGAFKSNKIGKRYIGSAFCFNKDGIFQNFDCYRDNDLDHLVADIRKALMRYVVDNETANRLIIHYYKTMGKKESQPIVNMLYRLGLNIPVIVVTINKTEESEIVAFDNSAPDKMPISGTIIQTRAAEFLLYNNSKYKQGDKCDYLFPVKIKIAKLNANGEKCDTTKPEVTEMLNRVYKFSRMYWKSVKQQNLPITIKYPEMVAEIVPHFSDAEMPPFGKTNLWFL